MRQILSVSSFIDSPVISFEVNEGQSMTDSTGYIPAAAYIKQLIEAGTLLDRQRARNSYYEYPDGVKPDDMTLDPTTTPDFDAVDAQAVADRLKAKLDELKAQESLENSPKNEEKPEASSENKTADSGV